MKMKYFYLILMTIAPLLLAAQQQNGHTKKAFVDSTGRYYHQASLPVYIYISTSPEEEPKPIRFATKKEVQLEGHGVHRFKHQNFLTKEDESITIFADAKAPVTSSSFSSAPKFIKQNQVYYGAGLSASLSSKDEMSGVESIYHSVNKGEFVKFDGNATSFSDEGAYDFSYYSVDRTGNVEEVVNKGFTVDLSPPNSFHNFVSISSENVISTNTTIYLSIQDSLSGVANTYYKFDDEEFISYSGGNIPFKHLNDGYHTITYYSIDNVKNEEEEKSFRFYLDKTAPIMSADILGDKFLVEDKVYFSSRTKLKITAVDNKSGIKKVIYSIDKGDEVTYKEPFYLPNVSGIHDVNFYAVDNTNNPVKDDFRHSVGVIYVDLTGPAINHSFNGPNFLKAGTVFISPESQIVLTANDPEAGLKNIGYNLGKGAADSTYTKPFSIEQSGLHQLDYFAYDNVNNRNAKMALFIVDDSGPEITYQFATPANEEGKYPAYSTIYLAAMDKEVGANLIKYSINGGKEKSYTAPISGFEKDKEYTLKIKAYDLLENMTELEFSFETDAY